MSDRSDRSVAELLDDIVLWGERIPELLGDQSFEEFRQDYKTYLAVWKCIEVIGEASGRLLDAKLRIEDDVKRQLRLAYAMRNRLTHGYPGVDLRVLLTTARTSVPALVETIRLHRREHGGNGE